MISEVAGGAAVSALTTHLIKWISNLKRAGGRRKLESRACLERVVLAVRKTSIYCRSLNEGQSVNHHVETEISIEWTSLAFELDRLELANLAKKCRVKGWYWEDQGRFDTEFLSKAQISFEHIERQVYQLLREIDD